MSSGWTPLHIRALILILLILAGGVFTFMLRRGRAAEAALTITGHPLPSGSPTLQTPTLSHPLPPGTPGELDTRAAVAAPSQIVVHIAGAVKKPGVYRLSPDSRAKDILKVAGGARPDANLDAVNLAARLEDGTQLFVPTRKQHPTGGANGNHPVEQYAAKTGPGLSAPVRARSPSPSRGPKFTKPGTESVNINTAPAQELQRLPGVGPAMSARIIQHRKETGRFTDPEQLMDVSGIGEKKFAKMKPFVRVR